jgi:hypothetical protein
MNHNLDARRHLYHRLSPQLTALDNIQIAHLVQDIATPHIWGTNGIVNAGGHRFFVLTDGKRFYLTDFEIAISQDWTLHKRERVFLQRHRHFDCGNFLSALCNYIYYLYRDLTKTKKAEMARRFGVREEMSYRPLSILLLEQFNEIQASGIMGLPAHFAAAVAQYSDIAAQINAFFYRMATSNRKDAQLDSVALCRMLKAAQFV